MIAEKIKAKSEEIHEKITEIRRHIHQNPERSFEEHETALFIEKELTALGIPFKRIAKTGLVALIEGKEKGKVVAMRADIDALPILEKNHDKSYRSRNEGTMHACGHDVHTASLLGAAAILQSMKEEFSGTIKLMFQPGEEKLPGGASIMINEGVLENPEPDIIIGQHVMPELNVGTVGFKSNAFMASADEIYLTVKGKGGHAAMPHKLIDPVLISSHLIVALQQVISRKCPPAIPSVLSFGKVIAQGATNIIPDEVKIEGTFRTFDEDWRKRAHEQIRQICTHLPASMGGSCEVDLRVGYPFLVNDEKITEASKAFAIEYLGKEAVEDLALRMTAEDFAYFSQKKPACFYRLGIANPAKNIRSALHTSTFDIDEDALKTGSGLMAYICLKHLQNDEA